jgi:hypothetical protein
MSDQSYEHTDRQVGRAIPLAQTALAAPAGEVVALKALAPEVLTTAAAYQTAKVTLLTLERATAKETEEALAAQAPLAKAYDEAVGVVTAKVAGTSFAAASTFGTVDDFFIAAEDLEGVLEEHQAEAWAKPLLDRIAPLCDAAAKEQKEATEAGKAAQKARQHRAQAATTFRDALVPFRRVVRATYGRSSKEYRSLLDRQSRGSGGEPTPPPAG